MKKLFTLAILVLLNTTAKSQGNLGCYYDSLMSQILCGSMSIQGDPDNICDDGVHLWVQFNPGAGYSASAIQEAFGSTDSFKVEAQPFHFDVQTAPMSANITTDDIWSQVIPLPFKFCFFENKYNEILIGANGQIGFDISLAGGTNNWNSVGWPALPYSNTSVNNSIFCPFQDINPFVGGTITYSTEGVAPCRKFIVNWENIPMYSCTGMLATQQIVLTEGSYRIDMNIISKPLCASWNGGNAYAGLQNATGTNAFTIPGYNGGQWSASNISWSFIPIGTHNLLADTGSVTQGLYWVDSFSNNIIGFGDTLHYWPSQDTTIYVFFGDTTLLNDSCFLANIDTCINACGKGFTCNSTNPYIRLHVIKPEASFSYTMNSTCVGAEVQFFNSSVNCSSYYWDFGDGSFDTSPNPIHTYIGTGPFNATLVGFGFTCSDTANAIIVPTISPVQAMFTLSDDSICGGTPITSSNTSIGTNLLYTWTMGDGTTYNTMNVNHTYTVNGTYTVQLVILDSLNGCTDSTTQVIYVDDNTLAKFTSSPDTICTGQQVYLKDILNNNTVDFYYDLGNGDTLFNQHNPIVTYNVAGDYNIDLFTSYPVCPSQKASAVLHVDPYPVVDLGDAEALCPGRGSITITDNNNPGATYLWSTGEQSNSIVVSTTGVYQVIVSYGRCETKDTKSIVPDLDCIFIPNAFSPNGDGNNDYFKPRWYDINEIGAYRMMIYNRYGQQVYFTDNKNEKGWNGSFKGTPCEMDTYMYYINIVDMQGNNKSFKGDVILVK